MRANIPASLANFGTGSGHLSRTPNHFSRVLNRSHTTSSIINTRLQSCLADLKPITSQEELLQMQQAVQNVFVRDEVLSQLQGVIRNSRLRSPGLSTRAALAFLRTAQAWAFLHEREFVIPEDLKDVAKPVILHRLQSLKGDPATDNDVDQIIEELFHGIA